MGDTEKRRFTVEGEARPAAHYWVWSGNRHL